MEQFGDSSPETRRTSTSCSLSWRPQMAAVQAALDSMSPEQRAQLQALAESLFEDMDLRWQVDRLSGNLQQAVPRSRLGPPLPLRRRPARRVSTSCGVGAAGSARWTSSSSSCARQPRRERSPRSTSTRPREYLGEDGARSLQRLAKLARELEDAGLINQARGPLRADREGHKAHRSEGPVRAVRQADQGPARRSPCGVHRDRPRARGPRPSLTNSGTRSRCTSSGPCTTRCARSGSGTPVRLTPDDFEIERTEALVRSSTVLMVDLSLSMPMRDNFLAAKKVAMALHSLISTPVPPRLPRASRLLGGRPAR